jgi:predicted chitinase
VANFTKAPDTLPRTPPAGTPQAVLDALALPGTYNIWEDGQYRLQLPLGNTTWKGAQARVVAVWGGDESGNRLEVVPRNPIVTVTLVSETPVAAHTHAWLVTPIAQEGPSPLTSTFLEAQTRTAVPGRPAGSSYSAPLPVTILPETATSATLPIFANGAGRQATIDAIRAECRRQGVALNAQVAYILATAEHESSFTPIREGNYLGARAEAFRRGLRYYLYYGRGFVQLTLPGNYEQYGTALTIPLAVDPDLALQANVALYVLVHGMMNGRFTGAPLTRYVNERGTDFVNARRVVNGLDRADHIADLARAHLARL